MLAPTDSTLYTCVTSQRGYRVQGARDSTNQSEGARVSDDQSKRGSSVDQSEPFSRHATRWQYKRPAPSFLNLSFNDALWSGAKTRPSSGMTSQRWHPVTRAWPISRSEWLIDLTYIQVSVIDWHVMVLVTGHLAADGATWRPMAELPGWRQRGDTQWHGRDLYPGQGDWLTWPISRLIDKVLGNCFNM